MVARGVLLALLAPAVSVTAQFQSRGNIAALRVSATGGTGLSPVYIDEMTPSGNVVGTITLPTTANAAAGQRACLLPPVGANAVSSEHLTLSQNEQVLMLPCFSGVPVGTVYGTSLGPTGGKTIARVFGDASLDLNFSMALDTQDTMLRALASPTGYSQFWCASSGGLKYFATGNPAVAPVSQTATSSNNIRSITLGASVPTNVILGVLGPMNGNVGGMLGLSWGLTTASSTSTASSNLLKGAGIAGPLGLTLSTTPRRCGSTAALHGSPRRQAAAAC